MASVSSSHDWGAKSGLIMGLGLLLRETQSGNAAIVDRSTEQLTIGGRGGILTCYCEGHCPDGRANGTCETKPHGLCFSAVQEVKDTETGEIELEKSYGCLPPGESGFMQCKSDLTSHLNGKAIMCCDEEDYCNQSISPKYEIRTTTEVSPTMSYDESIYYIALIISLTICITVCVVTIVFVYLRYKRREEQRKAMYLKSAQNLEYSQVNGCNTINSLIEQSSGSGSGLPLLVQRTIAKQIQMVHPIGKGRYGEVWLGHWRGEKVAVKVFFTIDEDSWRRETEIYQTVLMRHENILGFIAADIKGNESWTKMLLITDYHAKGSLYDYLQTNTLNTSTLLTMTLSIAKGLAHLHHEINGTKGKPAIAHRDIKSKNILVKNNMECAIADFGLAVRYLSDSKEVDIAQNERVGTKRYMAPEVLDESLIKSNFEAYKMADMYSLALVFWEMSRRCVTGDKIVTAEDYALPYQDDVPSDPSFDDMYLVVCEKGVRPPIPQRWESEELLRTLSNIMRECWYRKPSGRLTSLRVKKTLNKLHVDPTIRIV